MPASSSMSAAESDWAQSDKERQGAKVGGSGVYKPLQQAVASNKCCGIWGKRGEVMYETACKECNQNLLPNW